MTTFAEEIKSIVNTDIADAAVAERFLKRLEQGKFTRDEDSASHYCAYFLPYDPKTKRLFIIHHKKSGLRLSPGGYIDKDETLMQTLNRKIWEELEIKDRIKNEIKPFLLTITLVDNPKHKCREHLDVWYRFETDGSDFNVDPREFHASKWVTIDEARKLVTDKPNIEMLDR